MLILTRFLLWFVATCAWALPEGPQFLERYRTEVEPVLRQAQTGSFEGARGLSIAYTTLKREPSTRAIVVVPGYSESYLNYGELMADLYQQGYSVYVLDHRGMGLSGREIGYPQMVHVEAFQDYVTDLEKFVETVVLPDKHNTLYMLAHSTGGLIGTHLLVKRPEWFQKAFFNAPLFSLDTGGIPRWIAYAMARAAVSLGFGDSYVMGRQDLTLADLETKEFRTTHSKDRAALQTQGWRANPLTLQAGPSYSWIYEVFEATDRIEDLAHAIKIPVKILQAEQEFFVGNGAQNEFCRAAPHCELELIHGAMHEIFRESDAIRAKALKLLFDFLGR